MLEKNSITNDILRGIMCQLPMDNYAQFIGRLPDVFFQIPDIHRQIILKLIRRTIVLDGQIDPVMLAELVNKYMAQIC
jgi:hypothetical protein